MIGTTLPRRRAGCVVAGALAVSLGFTGLAGAAEYVMKFGTPTINELQHEWMKRYKDELEARTDGRIEVQLYPASQLGPVASVIEGMQLGTIEGNISPAEFYVGIDPRFQVLAVPNLFSSTENARATVSDAEVREHFMNIAVDRGLKGISLVVYGPQVFATRQSLESLSDLDGRRIRVLASETEMGAVSALGGAPVPMPLNEVSAALQQRAIDGLTSVINPFVALGTYEVAPNVADTHLWYLVAFATVSQPWLDSLPEDLQQAVIEVGEAIEEELFQWQIERNEQDRANWESHGGVIVQFTDEDQQAAEEAVAEVTERFLENNPAVTETYQLIYDTARDAE